MAQGALAMERLVRFNRRQLNLYFERFAGYWPETPAGHGHSYSIRCGSKILWSDDTMELKTKMLRFVATVKRRKKYRVPPTTINAR